MRKIIAISGWKGSGKDTAADYLVKKYGFDKASFASILKDEVAMKYDLPREHLDNQKAKEAPLLNFPVQPKDQFSLLIAKTLIGEFRSYMNQKSEYVGDTDGEIFTGFCMDENDGQYYLEPLYWTPRALCILEGGLRRSVDPDYWVKKTIAQMSDYGYYVIPDLRFKNEVEALIRAAGKDKVLTVRVNRFFESTSNDPSERDLDNYGFDITIQNRDTLEEFYRMIDFEMKNNGLAFLKELA